MMRKFLLLAFVILFVSVGSVGAYTIDYTSILDGNEFTSPVASATVETFDNNSLLWTWSGNYDVVSGSVSGAYAAPYGNSGPDASNYVTVPKTNGSGSATVTSLGGTYNYFGLWWGSVDDYNTLSFYLDGALVESFAGDLIAPPGSGNQTSADENLYVNFFDLSDFNSFEMTSTQYAFEADNIAVARVPEPSTLLLFGAGIAGLALYRRRK